MRSTRVVAAKFVLALGLLWSNSPLVGTSVASSTSFCPGCWGYEYDLNLRPATASNGSVHLVVWTEGLLASTPIDLDGGDIRGALVDASGNAIGSAFNITATSTSEMQPQVAWDGENFIVAWHRYRRSWGHDLMVARVSAEGRVLDTSGVVVAFNIWRSPDKAALAAGGPSSLVAWADAAGAVRSSRISRAGVVLDPGGRLVRPAGPLSPVSISAAWHDSRYLIVWDAHRSYHYTVFANRIDGNNGSVLDGDGFPVAAGPGGRYMPRVAGGPGGFLVVWTDGRANPYGTSWGSVSSFSYNDGLSSLGEDFDLYGARVSDAGIVLDPDGLVIAPGQGGQLWASVADAGGSWRLALVDGHPSYESPRAATTSVTSLPSLVPATPVDVSSWGPQSHPALSIEPSGRALVVWKHYLCDERCTEQIRGALLSGSGTTQLGVMAGVDLPLLSVSDAPGVAEGTPAMGHTEGLARFTVSLSAPASTDVSVDYKTAVGNATATATGADGDYKIADDTLVIREGETSGVVEVPVTMDRSVEPDEEFFLHLSEPSGAVLADSEGKATIYDDDPTSTATLSVEDVTVAEGVRGGTTQAIFTVKLSKPVAASFTVRAVTADGTAHPLPHESNDYVHLNQILSFAPHETTKQVAVTVNGDNIDERDETFFLALEDSTGPLRDKRQGVGVIANDDGFPAMSVDDVSVAEGNAGATEARFTISLAYPSFRQISVNYATLNGTARSTDHGTFGPADYASVSGVANFALGQTTHTVVVPVNGDILKEQNEQFVVQLSGSVNATVVKRLGTGTIRNDD